MLRVIRSIEIVDYIKKTIGPHGVANTPTDERGFVSVWIAG